MLFKRRSKYISILNKKELAEKERKRKELEQKKIEKQQQKQKEIEDKIKAGTLRRDSDGKLHRVVSEESKKHHSEMMKRKWSEQSFRDKTTNNPEWREKVSKGAKHSADKFWHTERDEDKINAWKSKMSAATANTWKNMTKEEREERKQKLKEARHKHNY